MVPKIHNMRLSLLWNWKWVTVRKPNASGMELASFSIWTVTSFKFYSLTKCCLLQELCCSWCWPSCYGNWACCCYSSCGEGCWTWNRWYWSVWNQRGVASLLIVITYIHCFYLHCILIVIGAGSLIWRYILYMIYELTLLYNGPHLGLCRHLPLSSHTAFRSLSWIQRKLMWMVVQLL